MELPARIGKYVLEEFLGGGMSHVYRGTDTVLGRRVAVKILTEIGTADPEAKQRFLTEARLASNFVHDNIVAVYDFGEESGHLFMVMEWVDGESLADVVRRRGPLPVHEALEIGLQIARALQAIHSKHILHRDVKPENIHVDSSGRVKLMDFGIAKTQSLSITRSGFTMGTPYYMAPEQVMGRELTDRVDIWAFGRVLYELLSGTRAIKGDSVERLFYSILHEPLDKIPLDAAQVPPAVQELIVHCTEKEPERRIQSFSLVIERIERLLPERTPARKVAPVGRAHRPGFSLFEMLGSLFGRGNRSQKQAEPIEPSARPESPKPVSPPAHIPDGITDMFRVPSPPPAPGSLGGAGEFTSMFQTAPAQREAATPALPVPPGGIGEFTRFFQVGPPEKPGSEPSNEAPADVALKITACSDRSMMGQTVRLTRFPFRIGRPGRDYALTFDPAISRDHFEINYANGGFTICDLGSSNKTFVEDRELMPHRPEPLVIPSRIRLGSNTELTFLPYRSDELPDLCGALIGRRYRLLEKLDDSWQSAMYKARHEEMGQPVLVKILSPSLLHHQGYRDQFKAEASTASSLSHPHITQILDSGETELPGNDRTLYVAIRYLEGGGLRKQNLPSLEAVADCFEKIASALKYVHAKNIVHGGIKPSSIVFDGSGNPYLTDFAIAVYAGDKSRRVAFGSAAFMAPEQWSGEELVPATDQYSLAAVLYQVITGAHPFEGQEHPSVRQRNYLQGPWPAHELAAKNGRPSVPAPVSEALQKALSVKPADRYPSVVEFMSAFRAALAPPSPPRRKMVFISYHRAESSLLSLMLKDRLTQDTDYEVFVDSEQQDSAGQFPLRLERKIRRCDAFVCLLAKSTLKAPWVQTELRLAHEAKRPMIPVFQESFKFPKDRAALDPHIRELIDSGGEKVWDLQNRHVRESIRTITGLIRQVIEEQPEAD
jgi:serine/threonine protein kinase